VLTGQQRLDYHQWSSSWKVWYITPGTVGQPARDRSIIIPFSNFPIWQPSQYGTFKNDTETVKFVFSALSECFICQVSEVCDALANDTRLANGFNAMGFGQGGLFLRALVERCGKVRVRNLISVGGPQQGSYGLPYCPGNNVSLCQVVHHTVIKHGVYTPWVQKLITVAQYWQDPKYEEKYEDCIFLPDLNQMNVTNPVYKERILTLTNFVLVKLELDRVVNPTESEWFGFYKPGQRKEIYTLEESDIWKKDLLGLRGLNSTGRLHFISAPYGYLNFTVNWFNANLLHYINGTMKTLSLTIQQN
jgi:palmitoyl-protein thioesterase